MPKRVTIMLDDDLVIKLHQLQAKEIKNTSKSVSFSKVINTSLRKAI